MIFSRIFLIGLGLFLCGIGCIGSDERQTQPEKNTEVAPGPVTFAPPPDSVIPPARLSAWFGCHQELDSLSDFFFSPEQRSAAAVNEQARNDFRKRQDLICVKNGLPGGYREYRWILDNLGSVKNRPVYDSMKSLR